MGWGGGGGSGWGIDVNPWLIHVNVWQKPLQYCKVISFQLITINGKKKQRNTQGPVRPGRSLGACEAPPPPPPFPTCDPGPGCLTSLFSHRCNTKYLGHRVAQRIKWITVMQPSALAQFRKSIHQY